MQEGRPSQTALRVAIRRAAHQRLDDPRVFEDPIALRIVGAEGAAALRAAPGSAVESRLAPYLRASMAARSRYAEDQLALAVRRGVGQYVILGAGLDTFGYRNPHGAALRVFEVDHPATQAWKRVRLQEAAIAIPPQLTFAPVDFERQSVSEGLRAVSYDAHQPAFFAWLGVTPYLSEAAVLQTLGWIATAPVGSGVVFDYALAPDLLDATRRRAFDLLAAHVAAAGEPWQTFFEPTRLRRELAVMGFVQIDDLGPDEINARYFAGRADGLRVGGLGRLVCAIV
ncbi:MAG: class I SAM-dependent methyltransferase [Candidatus Binatia bacterium]